mgnify:CR=1 FL=1|tara:strand:- start:10540 stop:12177 length:1638 start_codon:yes stop_codon:yes gene_type:complete
MKKYSLLFLVVSILFFSCQQTETKATKPKLVVGIVIDQMRYDYLTKYADRYGEDGFNRLLEDGYSLTNAHFNYMGTYTAVGHTSVYTGTTPNHHGIIGNNWYDKYLKKSIYCVTDTSYTSVGTDSKHGQKSPYRLFTTTITDQLRLAQNMNGKTIGIAIKDRSSILPVGHSATAAYWMESSKESKVITSSYYMKDLPSWVKEFNDSDPIAKYVSKPWETLYDISTYTSSLNDNSIFEGKFRGEETPTFPHDLPKLMDANGGKGIVKSTPFGNSLTAELAKAAIKGESLGKTNYTDFLAVSFSSTDYVGHKYGPNAIETEDTYLRLDKDLADFFQFLDKEVGKGNYTLFLTADHGAAQVPAYLQSLKIPAPYFSSRNFRSFLTEVSKSYFKSEKIVEAFSNNQIFLNKETLKQLNLNEEMVADIFAKEALKFKGVYKTMTAKTLQTTNFTSGVFEKIQNAYNQKLSGDVVILPDPASISHGRTGTTHGSAYSYDTHIPILFYGAGIQQGKSHKKYGVRDIAPTLATLLGVEFPNGTTGDVISEVLK